jgi:hypothetical protein
MRESHTYVECCERIPLVERTEWIRDSGVLVRICKEGTGCTTEEKEGQA